MSVTNRVDNCLRL